MEALQQSFNQQQQQQQRQQQQGIHQVAKSTAMGHISQMQASPATVLTLKARMLAIAQFVNGELSKLEGENER